MPRRLRTFILITGTLLSVLTGTAFVASARYYLFADFRGGLHVAVHAGALVCEARRGGRPPRAGCFRLNSGLRCALVWKITRANGFTIPLVYPFAAFAIPTLLAGGFWPKRRVPGHCEGGYNLTGNVSGTCPECGRPSEQPAKPPRGEGVVSRVQRLSRERIDADA